MFYDQLRMETWDMGIRIDIIPLDALPPPKERNEFLQDACKCVSEIGKALRRYREDRTEANLQAALRANTMAEL